MSKNRLLFLAIFLFAGLAVAGIALRAAGPVNTSRSCGHPPAEVKDPTPPKVDSDAPPFQSKGSGGPDAFGYAWVDNQGSGGPTYQFVDISGTGTIIIPSGDDTAGTATLGSNFTFYGTAYTQLRMASNGYISTLLSDSGGDLSPDCPIPATPSTGGGGRFYVVHDDLDLESGIGNGLYQYFATCPRASDASPGEPCSVIMWNNVAHYPGGSTAPTWDMEAILYHTSGDILYQIGPGNPEHGSGSTTGIMNPAYTIALQYACKTANSVPDGLAVRFYQPKVILSTPDDTLGGCPGYDVVYAFTVTNNTGAQTTFTITSSGNAWPLAYPTSVGPVANGATASFDVTHTIPAAAAPGATDSFTLTATSGSNQATKGCTTTAVASQLAPVPDGSFEAGTPSPYWAEGSTNFGTPLCDTAGCGTGGGTAGPRTGDWWSWFGGISSAEAGYVEQNVTTPTGGTGTLTFYIWNGAYTDTTGIFRCLMDGNVLFSTNAGDPAYTGGYTLVTVDISAYADGGTHLLRFDSTKTAAADYNLSLDDISMTAPCPAPPVGYDMNFRDQYNRSELCLDSTTGDYVYNVLTGAHAGDSFTGTANITPHGTQLVLFATPCPAGSTHCLSGSWNTTRHTAAATLKAYTPARYSQTLSDANYTDSPACGAP